MANETTDHLIQWLDNDESMYTMIMEMADEYAPEDGEEVDFRTARVFGERIRDEVIDPGIGLLGHMLGLVDWSEVGRHFLED